MSAAAMTGASRPVIGIDVISDVMCPWCFIGKRRLERAAAMLAGEFEVAVAWQPFQLDPTLPPEGRDRKDYLDAKFGGEAEARAIYAQVEAAGAGEGIDFNFDAIAVSPNTLDAHRLVQWAGEAGSDTQGVVVEQLFARYFLHGENIGDHAVLVKAAESAGMDAEPVRAKLATDRDRQAVMDRAAHASQVGVTGVPCFIIDQRLAVMGAQEPQTLVMAMRQAAQERQPN